MNNINNVFEKNEVENKLKGFQENKDYSVSPTEEPGKETYIFHNDKLRSMFRSDRVPVRITREKYDGQDYKYQGHFEEGKDYNYSAQQWHYGENYQGNRGTDILPNDHFLKDFMNDIKWDEHSRLEVRGEAGNFHAGQKYWEGRWTYRGKGNLNGNPEPKKIEPNFDSKPNGCCICGFKDIDPSDKDCQKCGALLCDEAKKTKSNLAQENQELRQQLATVQKQLAEVLEKLKKLEGKNSEKLTQELTQTQEKNQDLIKTENISRAEVREQVNKSQALLKEASTSVSTGSATASPVKGNDNSIGAGSLPYVIGGSVIVGSILMIGYLAKRKKEK